MNSRLEVRGLCKSFGAVDAIRDLNLFVRTREIVGLLGPNGAGKTTALSCIAGLRRADRGSVAIGGIDATEHGAAARQNLGYLADSPGLYLSLDLERNLSFFGALAGLRGRSLKRRVQWAIERFGLAGLNGRPVGRLSFGEQRIVHLASVLLPAPRVLLLDEPTANLDVRARQLVLDMVREVAEEGGAVLYCSHHMEEVERLCTRVVIIHRGGQIAEGTVADLLAEHEEVLHTIEPRTFALDHIFRSLTADDGADRSRCEISG